jgi:nucleotide-binding universal stress UspA family protein
MKRILVPTDFSVASRSSLKFAIELASRAQAEVFVLHMVVLPLLQETTFGIQPIPADEQELQKATKAANKVFEEIRKQFPSKVEVHFNTMHDDIVSGMQVFIKEMGIDQIVMSMHGSGDLEEFFIGSTAEKIARVSSVPVLSIPGDVALESIRNIVFPSNLAPDQDDLIKDLKDLQRMLHAKLHVLLINTPVHFCNERQAQERLEQFAKNYSLRDFTINFRSHQFESRGIIEFVNEIHGDMVAMATHGRSGLAHLLKGSIAEKVLHKIDYPIWTWKLK